MKRKNILILSLIIAFSIFLCACGNNTPDSEKGKHNQGDFITPTQIQEPTITIPDFGATSDRKEIEIYSVSESSFQKEAVTALVTPGKELTPEVVIELVDATFEERGFYIVFDEVTTSEDTIIVSFKDSSVQLSMTDARIESCILDAIAQSLLDNLGDYTGIVFRVNGEAYNSLNNSFEKDYIYMGR